MRAVIAALLVTALLSGAPGDATPAAKWAGCGEPTAEEQQFLELLNAFRADPEGLQKRLGIDLTEKAQFKLAPRPPLVMNGKLTEACRYHSQDMNDKKYFGHFDAAGKSAGDRMKTAGYPWRDYRENITAVYEHPQDALDALIIDEGLPTVDHRLNLLAMTKQFEGYDEAGVGIITGDGPYKKYYTAILTVDADPGVFLLGSAYKDANKNGLYDAGEGLPGIKIRLEPSGAETRTGKAGGYGIPLKAGSYMVVASGEGLDERRSQVQVSGQNVKADFVVKVE